MSSKHMWETVAEWGREYGDIIYVNILGQPLVFLNSPKAASDMLEKKSLIYSDRPSLTMACELVGWEWTLGLKRFGEEFRAMRKLFHTYMGTRASVQQFAPIEEEETKAFLKRVLEHPEDLAEAIRRTAGAVILRVTYDYEPKDHGDSLVQLVDRTMEQFAILTSPNAFLVDVLPILKYIPAWFPGANFKRIVPEWAQCTRDVVEVPLGYVKEQMAKGVAAPSFASRFLDDQDLREEDERIIKWAAGSMYGGGADTTVSSIKTFFLTMTLYPEAQKKAQAEIDAVIGNDRLPSLADQGQLPYVDALVKEVFRWHPVVPLDLPHRLMQDDIHEGYFIPEGTVVVANIWKMLHDPKTYANPMVFNPSRFLGEKPELDPREYCFGFGRRVCPGRNLAEASVWLSCAMSLAVFNIMKAKDQAGRAIEPEIDFSSATISHPAPFKCSITPRSDAARALILAENEAK
ncbi:cytochrome P450 [Gloeophyllum trabeum ATCC 11539]|uniref:Cytochrome P450 n=1 Tax=Gloeophyllum trabeum (strain ATCC 11539 / FP-39264 / Madison 617) TaxID=670483 RepID=S7RK84_GLOTA|nr:cytochrome P450 [Gloeophyllum trabeum ATCC 11539]EPQ54805.1 cytochrome P450 [Gloeophyllum trabeum ATCC 11539]